MFASYAVKTTRYLPCKGTIQLTSYITTLAHIFRIRIRLHFATIQKLSRLPRLEKAVKNTTIIVPYRVLVYIQVSANYMFRPLLVRPSSGWIPSPRKYINNTYIYTTSLCTRPIFVNEISSPPDFNGCIALLYISLD